MADNKGNILKRLGKRISDIFAELKRVTWPTGDKLAKTAAVVLLVIVFFAVYLTLISGGGRWILDKVGFYDIVETTATESVAETTPAT
jgi:preprotein translocase SecE subunit